ncbi:hypothetical protein LOAG_16489 [Loa loa]|uniref:Shugoshin_C domain-containing protein n=1 Tax=Loa loa TaxID=7209 RepID=A0A1I7VSP5_LOALO|nr:hypothetical protein LOAG_16489 [Loa loa]EJD76613.1 hypothetical protein LOAG_16489 [Loa loa]
MAAIKTSGANSSSVETFGNKLSTVQSNRSLVAANQQLRIQLAFAKAEISRLQNEIVDLQRRIAGLESTSDEERIEMIVRKRLQQRVQHLKSIANRTLQYMKKTKADFDYAAGRLDHVLLSNNFDDGDVYTGGCSRSVVVPSTCEKGNEILGRHAQQPSALEAVEEDIYGEMDENEDAISDRVLIVPISSNGCERSSDGRKSSRNSRRQTFFIKKEPHEFDPSAVAVPAELVMSTTTSGPRTSATFSKLETSVQMVSLLSTQNHEDPSAVAAMTELITPTTICAPETSTVFSNRETLTTTTYDENTPAKNNQIEKLEIVMHTKKKRKISTNETPKRCKKSSGNNAKATKEISKLLTVPSFTPSTGISNVANLNEKMRYKRAAAAKISSFKEPNLVTKMRNPNVNGSI